MSRQRDFPALSLSPFQQYFPSKPTFNLFIMQVINATFEGKFGSANRAHMFAMWCGPKHPSCCFIIMVSPGLRFSSEANVQKFVWLRLSLVHSEISILDHFFWCVPPLIIRPGLACCHAN
ncbi:hypothetical protein TWF569_004356 [Orbilia oligospora]|nr:hypothetical protein TWF594_010918 [Orbilia oligospora]KAF3150814.1 hypothetical protein TWF569_004356 [Orbilia oligospora]